MLSGQFQGFITQTFAHFQDRILTLHTVHRCALCLGSSMDAETGHNHVDTATQPRQPSRQQILIIARLKNEHIVEHIRGDPHPAFSPKSFEWWGLTQAQESQLTEAWHRKARHLQHEEILALETI
jgi:hypothetical protein